ncbi:ABC-2 type transport system ATP-binding protein [Lentzea waywayandensis]|uniref:ABC-2 type transport system ATP-binding protein n=1 Tax=Lentzea waywayandensis TaxID=84724 RepID=A0A1I6FJP4_9PSEU|nr:ATP-binding cassette domain-containing protein [Lentzea waywayandensis]SFR30166.1 ABC-2 type transport system ATP-binding protein [Lentzea waywayandensis]
MIEADGIARTYVRRGKKVEAVRDLTLRVDEGEIVGFLGPNGAGKTTTMRILTTLLRPTSGKATIAGRDLIKDPNGVRARIGYVPQGTGLYDDNTALENLVLQGRMHGMTKSKARQRAMDLVEQLQLTGFQGQLAKTLSGGQRRRVDIALALVHRPHLLFLDEPTNGLDPQSRANLWDHIRSLRGQTTVFLSTHYLNEADALADRVFVIDHGSIVTQGSPAQLKATISEGDLIQFGVPQDAVDEAARIAGGLRDASGVEASSNGLITFRSPNGEAATSHLIRHLVDAEITLLSLQLTRPTLDDVFLSVTGRSLRDDSP